jgi:dipeptidyl aminopeptidase/acylaminoacyl peptidase
VLLIHGDEDTAVPLGDTIEFHNALLQSGVDASLRVLPGIGHSWDTALTRDDIAGFFMRTLMQ